MKTTGVLTLVPVISWAICPFLFAALEAQPFPLDRVTLLDSPFKKAMEINRAYLLKLDADRFLWPFHQRAGMETKGKRYGGWEKLDVVGQTTAEDAIVQVADRVACFISDFDD